jgi:hypothetical protein
MAAVVVPVKGSLIDVSHEQNGFKLVYYFVLQIFGITIGGGAAMRETVRRHQEAATRTQEELDRTKAQNQKLNSLVIQSTILFALLAATIGAQTLGLISLRTESLLYAATMGSAVTLYGPRILQFLAGSRSGPNMDETRAFVHRIVADIGDWLARFWSGCHHFITAPFSTTGALSHPDRNKQPNGYPKTVTHLIYQMFSILTRRFRKRPGTFLGYSG